MTNDSRRYFLKCGACLCVSALTGCNPDRATKPRVGKVTLMPVSELPHGRTVRIIERLALYRDERGIAAMSLVCTHQSCLVTAEQSSFVCPCHGSRFNLEGKVLDGPAKQDLPWYGINILEDGRIEVDFSKLVAPNWRLSINQS